MRLKGVAIGLEEQWEDDRSAYNKAKMNDIISPLRDSFGLAFAFGIRLPAN